jgi:uncharacterized protein DUF6600
MKSRIAQVLMIPLRPLVLVAAVVPFVTACAEEEAESPEVAYPVGVTIPPSQDPASPQMGRAAAQPVRPEAPPAPESGSQEVVIGDDTPSSSEGVAQPPSSSESAAPAPGNGERLADSAQSEPYADTDPSALTDFRGALDPYGAWVDDATYGTAWVPSRSVVGPDFAPYQTAGHWAYDDDYVWVSDYSWGWAPFHYGRWVYVPAAGWEWIPGRTYAGAWVSWRYGWDDWAYVGWAPLSPTWCWRRGVAVGVGFVPVAPYAFVATGDLFAPRIGGRFVAGDRVGLIAAHTRPWAGEGVAGRVVAHPGVGGPPPATLRIPATAVVQAAGNRGVMQARAFARSSTPNMSMSLGARPGRTWEGATMARSTAPAYGPAAPEHFGGRLGGGFTGSAAASGVAGAPGPGARFTAPAYGPPAPSHFGGRFGGGFSGSPAAPGPVSTPTPFAGSTRPYFAPSPSSRMAPTAPSYRAASPGPSPSFHVGPAPQSFSSSPTPGGFHGGGGYSSGFHSGFTSGFHGGGGAAPSSGGFHSGGGGGFRGGGGGRGGGHR